MALCGFFNQVRQAGGAVVGATSGAIDLKVSHDACGNASSCSADWRKRDHP